MQIATKMKRKLFFAASLILIACSFTACELLGGNCEICQRVSYEGGDIIATGDETEFCDEDLLAIKAIGPTTVGGVTTQWECR